MPNITVVTHSLTRNDGQGRVNAEIVAAVASRWQVDVIVSDVAAELLTLPNVRWHRISVPAWLPSALLRYQWFAWAARRVISRWPTADVLQLNGAIVHGLRGGINIANFVHSDWIRSPLHPARVRLSLNGVYQGLFTRLNAVWERRVYARAERVVAVSEQVRDALVQRAGVRAESIDVIEPGVDSSQFRPLLPGEANMLRTEMSVGDDVFVLLFVGDIRSSRKNLDLVLNAVTKLPDQVQLAVIGDQTRSPYPAMAERLGISGRVHFLGRRTSDLPALMRGADLFVFPSHYDPFARVVTEAMASGGPVIPTRTVGASGLIRSGENGVVLTDAADAGALAGVVRDLSADPSHRCEMAKRARRTAESYTWEAMTSRYEALYRRLLADRH